MTQYKTISIAKEREELFEKLMEYDSNEVGFSCMLADAVFEYIERRENAQSRR